MSQAALCEIDHLVFAARTLDEGRAWLTQKLGVAPTGGGQHVRMGTHNTLMNLGNGVYLEMIAIDPALPQPARPRWFGLDSAEVQALLARGPTLIHWVARTAQIEHAARLCGGQHGDVIDMERGAFKWKITVPSDGHRPGNGLVPTLIQWEVDDHPTRHLPESNVRLVTLGLRALAPDLLRATIHTMGLDGEVIVVGEGTDALVAVLQTPAGMVTV
jgi:hypothetical protein